MVQNSLPNKPLAKSFDICACHILARYNKVFSLSVEQRASIVALSSTGYYKILEQLNLPRSTVFRVAKKWYRTSLVNKQAVCYSRRPRDQALLVVVQDFLFTTSKCEQ